jgi:hypothetical protein
MDRNSNKINEGNSSGKKQTSWGKVADWYDDVDEVHITVVYAPNALTSPKRNIRKMPGIGQARRSQRS